MKNLHIRMTLALALLIALVAVFGVITTPSAHAATTRTTPAVRVVSAVTIAPSAVLKPNISGVGCGDPQFFTIFSLFPSARGGFYQVANCYANAGYTEANIPLAYEICTGNNAGQVLLQNPYEWLVEPQHNTCYGFNYATILAVQIY